MDLQELRPFWFFIFGLILLYLFALLILSMKPRGPAHYRPGYRPASGPWLGPGGTRWPVYEGFFDSAAPTFYMFGVDWCGYCKKAKPIFDQLKATGTNGVDLVYVDAEKEKAKTAGFEISGYPTFYLAKGSQKIKYDGPRTVDGFQQFLQKHLAASA
jgi:thiol-disulfide isomerase/thioredoxin